MPGGKAGYRAGIPQQPYTKWDTDKDEVEVDYKQLDDKHASWFSGRKGIVLRILIILVIFSLGLIIGYIIRRSVHELILSPNYKTCAVSNGYEGYNSDVSEELRGFIDPGSMEANLKLYTQDVHPAGVHNNNELRELLKQQLRDFKVKVKEAKYEVLLSFPDLLNPNMISLLNGSGEVMTMLQYEGPHPRFHLEWAAYNAYSPNSTVEGQLVYANYGEKRDFELLKERGVKCEGNIVILRYGNIYRGEKVANAEACGAAGVIFYSDPADVQGFLTQPNEAFPNSWWLPGWAVQRGTIIRDNPGDPLTPGLPATDGMYRLPEHEAKLPRIPVQPISHDAAHQLLLFMKGPEGPTRWKGSMHGNITYQLGPGYEGVREDWRVRLEVHNEQFKKVITNVFGIIEGFEEPDRYVIVGSHYDAWLYGAVDPNTGTAVLMELAKAFANLTTKGWRPRRSIIFAHWDAEEQGMHGSYEWVEENGKELSERTVAYINLDAAVMGNYSLWMQATPPLRTLIKAVSHMIRPATSGEDEIGAASLYDEWVRRSPSDDDLNLPLVQDMGAGSDHAPFLFTLGIPSMWPSYVFDMTGTHQRFFPGYHTAIDNFTMVKDFIDPDFQAHRAIAELVAEVTLQLASHTKLPMDCREFATTLGTEFNELKATVLYDGDLDNQTDKPANHVLDHLQFAVGNFTTVANNFMEHFNTVSNKDVLELRRMNDKLIRLSRAFIHPEGLPGRPHLKNILYAPSATDNYAPSTFTAIRDAFENYDLDKTHQNLQQLEIQISIATHSVQTAISILTDSIIT